MGYVLESKEEHVTSSYGNREFYMNGKLVKDFHAGIDLVKKGYQIDKIIAFQKGKVIAVRTGCPDKNSAYGYGNYVKLQHNGGFETLYCHLKEVYVKEGDIVEDGQVIGYMGQSGYATGVHLHFEIRINGKHTNPAPYLQGQDIPAYEEFKPQTQKLILPAHIQKWRIYPLDKAPVVGNEKGFLLPSKFGGLEYDIIRYTQSNVAVIGTRDYGEVQIYVGKDTDAIIKKE